MVVSKQVQHSLKYLLYEYAQKRMEKVAAKNSKHCLHARAHALSKQ